MVSGRRKFGGGAAMKFRSVAAGSAAGIAGDPNGGAPAGGGGGGGAKQPLAEAATVWHVLTMMVMHLARKVLFGLDISLKVGLYLVGVLVLSAIGDFGGGSLTPNFYLARPDNALNIYLIKYGWGWTLALTSVFATATGRVYGCGRPDVLRRQVGRMLIATGVWYGITGAFLLLEERSGACLLESGTTRNFGGRAACTAAGLRWRGGLDLSGHCFLLVWNCLFITEEARSYLGWERIRHMVLNEEFRRLSTDPNSTEHLNLTALSKLSLDDFLELRKSHSRLTPLIRLFFCLMAALSLVWDVALVATTLYFHIMIEKVVATCVAVCAWFLLYRVIYTQSWSPGLPGEGPFKYYVQETKQSKVKRGDSLKTSQSKWTPKDEVPKFMGMPLYALGPNRTKDSTVDDDKVDTSETSSAIQRPLGRTRSSSRSIFSSKYF